MKRLAAALAIIMLLLGMAAAWLVMSTAGARWIMESVSRPGGLQIVASKMEGRLFDHLQLSNLHVTWAHTEIAIERLELEWQPLKLWAGHAVFKSIKLQGLKIQDNSTQPLSLLPWPKVSGIATLLQGQVDQLEIRDISYRPLQQAATHLDSINAALIWHNGQLSVSNFSGVAQYGQVIGTMTAGFDMPAMQLDLIVLPTQAVGKMDRFIIQTKLLPEQGKQLSSAVLLMGNTGDSPVMQLEGEITLLTNGINMSQFIFTHYSSPGENNPAKIKGEGTVILDGPQPVIALRVQAKNLDLAAELGWPAHVADDLSLTLTVSGSVEQYQGHLTILNVMPGQQSMRLEGDFVGDQQGLKIAALTGTAWGGKIGGNLELAWGQEISLHTRMQGRQLDPAKMADGWWGIINVDVSGHLVWPQHQPVQAAISAKLLHSRLHGQALQGEISAQYVDDDLLINNILLRGRGFNLHAAGKLNQRVGISANITDLALLMPAATGTLGANGWVRWRNGQMGGAATVHGQHLAVNGVRVNEGKLDIQVREGKTARLHLAASLQQVVLHDRFQATAVVINGDGTLLKHTYSVVLHSEQAEASLEGGGSYQQKKWHGQLTRFSGHDSIGPWNLAQPTTLNISTSNISLAPFILTGLPSERLELSAELTRDMTVITAGEVRATWSELNLVRASVWLQDIQFAGSSSGAVSLNFAAGQMRTLQGTATMAGTILRPGWSISIQRSEFNLHGDQQGLHAEIDLHLDDGGNFKGNLSSSLPAHLQWPDAGNYAVEWSAIDLALLQPWLSSSRLSPASTYETRLEGKFSGRAAGHIFSGRHFDMEGRGEITESLLHWRSDGEINVNLRSAEISWQWKEMLHADWTVVLAQLGQIHGNFQLPIAAHFPLLPEETGAVHASVIGQVQESGTLTTLFPGLVQESQGQLDVDIQVSGQWQEPLLHGKLQLSQAAAYLPTTGIHVKDIQLNASLEKNLVRIDSFQASSGPGRIQGTALLTLQGTQIIAYQGTLDGERFQTVYFPELQVLSSPHLTFNGSADKLVVRGEIQLPELHIMGPQANAVVLPSKDVVVEGTAEPASAASLMLDAQIKIVLGDEVTVHAKGMDAKLSGSLDIVMESLDNISSKGEIRIVQGSYQTYGVSLDIVRGHLFYSDGPVDEPTLDILALRTIGDVRAGVTVAGTLKAPITKLYSEPAMPDVDILAYIVLGHPLDNSREQESLVTLAANALLSSGQSAALQDQVKRRFGLGDVEIQVVGSGSDGHMGYKAIPVNPPGAVSSKQGEGLPQAMITVGKYVTPKIYISYGRSLFTGGKMFFLRYDISRRWQVETQTGGESGVDMYYKIEFN